MDGISEELARMLEYEVDGRDLNADIAETQKQTVFFGNTIETPGVIGLVFGQIADFFHPVTAPGAGIEVRNDTEGAARRQFEVPCESSPEIILGRWGSLVSSRKSILEQSFLQAVGRTPVDEEGALIFQRCALLQIAGAEIPDLLRGAGGAEFPSERDPHTPECRGSDIRALPRFP